MTRRTMSALRCRMTPRIARVLYGGMVAWGLYLLASGYLARHP